MFFENDADSLLRRFLSGEPLLPGRFSAGGDPCQGACDCDTHDVTENDVATAAAGALGPTVRYYGFVAAAGPDGRPVMYEYGNTGASAGARPHGRDARRDNAEREPLVDTMVDEKAGVVKVIAEMPGVEKRDIRVAVEDDGAHVSVSAARGDDKKYRMRIPLERRVSPNTAKATYRNGVLQISFNLVGGARAGKTIRVD